MSVNRDEHIRRPSGRMARYIEIHHVAQRQNTEASLIRRMARRAASGLRMKEAHE